MEKAREAYAIGQQKQRQWNAEILEYERMKAHYKGIGEEPPYQTLGAFRRAKRANAESYEAKKGVWSGKIADASKYGEKSPKPKGYNQELVKSANYQKKFEEIVPTSLVRKITVAAREVIRENNRKNEETAIAYTLSGEQILKQHSSSLKMKVDLTVLHKQPKDSVIFIHNHPQNDTFSDLDLGFMANEQIHTLIAVGHDGKIFSLRTNCGKKVDEDIIREYNRYIDQGMPSEAVLLDLAKKYGWEYKEV